MSFPTLNPNKIYNPIYNMIINQSIVPLVGDFSELVDKAKEEGTMFGDTKIYYASDAMHSTAWDPTSDDAHNLLETNRAKPSYDAITMDVFRQVFVTVDNYLTKQAWLDEGSFSAFNASLGKKLTDCKRIYDVTTYNTFVGTDEVSAQNKEVDASTAGSLTQAIADIMDEMTRLTKDYNEAGYRTKFDKSQLHIVWNKKYINKVDYTSLPSIYHNEKLKAIFEGDVMDDIYFGKIDSTKTAGHRSMDDSKVDDVFPGEVAKTVSGVSRTYTVDDTIICKIFVQLPPYMSGFNVSTEFVNSRALDTNKYLTWGHNTLKHLKYYPCVTVRAKKASE